MNKFILKHPTEEKFFINSDIKLSVFLIFSLENLLKTNFIKEKDKEVINELVNFTKNNFKEDKGTPYYNEKIGIYKKTLPIKVSIENHNINYGNNIEEIINEVNKIRSFYPMVKKVYTILLELNNSKSHNFSKNNLIYFMDELLKVNKISSVFPKNIKDANIIEIDISNKFVSNKGYAIFSSYVNANNESESIFVNASLGSKKYKGNLTSALLFDTTNQAKNFAKNNSKYKEHAIVEIDLKMVKVIEKTSNFNSNELDSALSIIEKEKLEKFFEEHDLDKIEQKLIELKNIKNNIILNKELNSNNEPKVEKKKIKI